MTLEKNENRYRMNSSVPWPTGHNENLIEEKKNGLLFIFFPTILG